MIKNLKLSKKQITVNNIDIHLDNIIEEYLIFEDIIIIRLAYEKGNSFRNIIAFNSNGEQIWRIPLNTQVKFPFVRMKKVEEKLEAYNFSGLKLTMQPKTGHILSSSVLR